MLQHLFALEIFRGLWHFTWLSVSMEEEKIMTEFSLSGEVLIKPAAASAPNNNQFSYNCNTTYTFVPM